MTKRDFYKELNYYVYNDPDYGEDIEHISYPSLICIIGELCIRVEELESRLNELYPPMNDVFGPTGLIGDPQ